MNKLEKIEKEVLKNYTEYSPSKLPLEDERYRKIHFEKRKRLFQDLLKMPIGMFKDSNILDFGCGTGEQTITYASWGAKCTGIDMNPISTTQTKKYFASFNLENNLVDIQTKSLFDFSSDDKFDIIISEGVLHHTQEPKKGFDIAVKHLNDDGFIVLQLAFDTSHLQRSLQRLILDYLTDGEKEKVVEVSKVLFKKQLDRANKFGGRSVEQIVYDFYTNPKHKGISIFEILDWFREHNIRYYSSYPMIEIEGLMNGLHKKPSNEFIEENLFVLTFSNFLFMIANKDDEDELSYLQESGKENIELLNEFFEKSKLRDYEYGEKDNINLNDVGEAFKKYIDSTHQLYNQRSIDMKKKIDTFATEFNVLIEAIKLKDLELISEKIDSFCLLFNGYNGVPSNYIAGYKFK